MWWEILPSATIVFVLLNIPHYGGWVVNNIFNNRHSFARRWEVHETDYRLYWRDRLRITGSEYKPQLAPFHRLAPEADEQPYPIPDHLWKIFSLKQEILNASLATKAKMVYENSV